MGWLTSLIGARWFPFAAIGLMASVGIVFGWGYMKGYGSAEETYFVEMNRALANQMKDLLTQKELEIKLVLRAEQRKHNVSKKIAAVPKPANSCDMSDECLRWYDDILRASSSDRPGTD